MQFHAWDLQRECVAATAAPPPPPSCYPGFPPIGKPLQHSDIVIDSPVVYASVSPGNSFYWSASTSALNVQEESTVKSTKAATELYF